MNKRHTATSKRRTDKPPVTERSTNDHAHLKPTQIHEHFFRHVIDSIEDYAVFTMDKKGIVTTWNPGAQKLLGFTEYEILGKSADLFFTSEDIKKNAPSHERTQAIKQGRALDERWHVKKGKSKFWASGMLFPIKDDQENIIGFTKVLRDLTEKRWGMTILKQSEERYRAFIQNSTEGIWRFELEKPILISSSVKQQINAFYKYAYLAECNDIVAKMYGYKKAEEIIGMRLGEFLIKENKQNIEYLTAFIASGYRLSEVESQERDKDGNDKFFLNNLVGIIENGYLVRAWGTQRDITEQKRTEVSLKQLAEIVEYSEDSIIRRKLDGTVLSWNKGAEKMYGFTEEQMIGKDVKVTIPEHLQHEADDISRKIINGEHIDHFETVRKKRDGTPIDISLSVSAIKDVSGTIAGISTIARDITENKRLQKQKDEFIGIASHELKTPVTSIKAYAQVIQKRFAKKGDAQSALLMAKMDTQLNKLSELIGDLLDVTKIESGKFQFNLGYYDFTELVEEIVEEMQRTTDKHNIELHLGKTRSVYGDRDRIGQVIMNLISNAIKYSPKADRIVITTKSTPTHASLCVKDFGVGIPKSKQPEIFQRFYRVSGPNNTTFPGMGLGLYISSEIVKRLGGKIWVESEKGRGSTFCFTLPAKKRHINT